MGFGILEMAGGGWFWGNEISFRSLFSQDSNDFLMVERCLGAGSIWDLHDFTRWGNIMGLFCFFTSIANYNYFPHLQFDEMAMAVT